MGAAKKTGAQRWLMRGAIAAVAGLVIGGAGGVMTVRTLEPGRANAVDSVQAVLDSIARGTIASGCRRHETSPIRARDLFTMQQTML